MADRQRRRSPLATARLAALLLANALLLAFLAQRLFTGGVAAEGAERAVEPAAIVPAALHAGGATASPATRRDTVLERRLRTIVDAWRRKAAARSTKVKSPASITVGVHVRDLADGAELASLDATRSLRPASNMKLVTTAAALVLLGPGGQFETPALWSGEVAKGTLHGDLVLLAGGDPFCDTDGSGRVEARLDVLASVLRDAGVSRIAGDVVLDEADFLVPGPGPAWPDPSQHWTDYCARAGGFSLNGGVLVTHVTAGAVGAPATVAVHPGPTGLEERLGVTTRASGKLDVRVGATTRRVTVKGELPRGSSPFLAEFSHPDPVQLFGAVLLRRLARGGVTVQGELRRVRGVAAGERGGLRPLATLRSPIAGVLGPINADSRNGVADQLFLALGHAVGGSGTRAGGAAAVSEALRRLGVAPDGLVQVDGSGLSRDDRVTAEQLTALLAAVLGADAATADVFRDSLAVAGKSGTLAKRLKGTPAAGRVFGKTGWIRGTSALSGIAECLDGRRFAFSILVTYPPDADGLNTACFKPMQDELVRALVEAGS
jgi:D-alanyl-D-alanine carboxypeptidase/D-alanyl-D-alanine-endopeptidase (penicillin-binding protein 4)